MKRSGNGATVDITGRSMNLPAPARKALIDIGTSRQGAMPAAGVTTEALSELSRLGLIGPGGGLTRTGSITRDRIVEEEINDLF